MEKISRHNFLYGSLIFAFLLKTIGAGWDASYHFKYLREFYQMPHLLNGFGNILVAVLFFFLWRREPKAEQKDLKIILAGILTFIGAIIFDQWWHARFGIDLTTWSPSHFSLYLGTLIGLMGAILYIAHDWKHGKISAHLKTVYCIILFFLALDSFWFPLLQQEQGVITAYYMAHGIVTFGPDLEQAFAAAHLDIYRGVPDWLYGAYAVFSLVTIFTLAKRLKLHRYSATLIAGQYLLFRILMNFIFIAVSYPTSTVPYYILPIAFLFDFFYNAFKERTWIQRSIPTALIILGINGLIFVKTAYPLHPPMPPETFLFSIGGAVIGYLLAEAAYRKVFRRHML